jgi:hypothetical protein
MRKLLLVTMFFAFACSVGLADTFTISTMPPNYFNGVPVGPISATLDSPPPITVWCVDHDGIYYVPGTTTVAVNTIPFSSGEPWPPKFDQTQYEEAAILISLYGNSSYSVADIQYAIWLVTGGTSLGTLPPNAVYLEDWVEGLNLSLYNYSGVEILTPNPDDPDHQQEFMFGSATYVPEPSLILLLSMGGFAALAASALIKKK